MSGEAELRAKLQKIEALFAGAGTAGEKMAAEAALARVKARLDEMRGQDPAKELQFSISDLWSRQLFLALCRRYGLKPYRYPRQRQQTIMLRVPQRFHDQVLWPEYNALAQILQAHLNDITQRLIHDEINADTSDAAEAAPGLPDPSEVE